MPVSRPLDRGSLLTVRAGGTEQGQASDHREQHRSGHSETS